MKFNYTRDIEALHLFILDPGLFNVFGIDPEEMIRIITDKLVDDVKASCSRLKEGGEHGNKMNLKAKSAVFCCKRRDHICKVKGPEHGSNETAQIRH